MCVYINEQNPFSYHEVHYVMMRFEHRFKLDMYLKCALICLDDIFQESVEALNDHFANIKFAPKTVIQ